MLDVPDPKIEVPRCRPVVTLLSLGSNLGQRREQLELAVERLLAAGLELIACSGFYETEPVGLDGPSFVNAAASLRCPLPPQALHQQCRQIEVALGRRRSGAVESRTVDIDILFYGELVLDSKELVIPHPRFSRRRFVLVPLAEIAPDHVDPHSGQTVGELLARCSDKSWVKAMS